MTTWRASPSLRKYISNAIRKAAAEGRPSLETRARIVAGVVAANHRRVICPSCGRLVGAKQLGQHEGSKRCLTR